MRFAIYKEHKDDLTCFFDRELPFCNREGFENKGLVICDTPQLTLENSHGLECVAIFRAKCDVTFEIENKKHLDGNSYEKVVLKVREKSLIADEIIKGWGDPAIEKVWEC